MITSRLICLILALLLSCTNRHSLNAQLDSYKKGKCRSRTEIMAIVDSYVPGMNDIYNARLKNEPEIAGKIIVKFSIDTMGIVMQYPIIESSTLSDSLLENRFIEFINTWQFGKSPAKCGPMELVYPFMFAKRE